MAGPLTPADDERLLGVFLEPVLKSAEYRPAFGSSEKEGYTFAQFEDLYGADVFYSLLGLDTAPVYAAHRAAGGLTSVYRQIGIGCERLAQEVIKETLGLTGEQVAWGYEYLKEDRKMATHTLDARISLDDVQPAARGRVSDWLRDAAKALGAPAADLKGAVFEVRQGYKSADSKRQNADLRFGMRAYQVDLLPTFALMSNQMSAPVVRRYRADRMLVLTGTLENDPTTSTFVFFREVVGYDLYDLFSRNSEFLRAEVTKVVATLLSVAD